MTEQEIIKKFRDEMKDGLKSPTLKRADDIIHGERQDQYGDPEDSFKLIAEYWSMYLRSRLQEIVHYCDIPDDMLINLGAQDTAIMLALMKIARMSGQKWHKDNAVDACGYLAILNDRIKSEG